ncbi:MAG: Do family serine endopeptidase [Pseudomonadota bacterium]
MLAVSALVSPAHARAAVPDYVTLVEEQQRSVVKVTAQKNRQNTSTTPPSQEDQRRRFFGPRGDGQPARGLGSGVVISADGYIVTNHHVIDGADSISVSFYNRDEHTATLVGSDPRTDIALLKVDTDALTPATLGNSADLKVGQWVIAIGAPFGFDFTATQGIISALSRSLPSRDDSNYVPFIQTDVAVNPGNSGGPLFNTDGDVIGINSQIYTRSGGFMGLSFAIPANVVEQVTTQLKEHGRVRRGWLGVSIQEVDQALAESFGLDTPRGSLIADVVPDGPAANAGLQAGDIILSFNSKALRRSSELPALVGTVTPSESVPVVVLRAGEEVDIDVTIGELDEGGALVKASSRTSNPLGATARSLSENERSERGLDHGLLIESIAPEGLAAGAGLQPGDVLLELDGRPMTAPSDIDSALNALDGRERVAARIDRDGNSRFIPIRVPS